MPTSGETTISGEPTTGESGTSSESSSSGSTVATSVEPICGDGVVEGDEACDDGNRDPDDGCDLCAAALFVRWSVEFGGQKPDYPTAVAVAGDGGIYVGGVTNYDTLVVRKFDSAGAVVWMWSGEFGVPSLAATPDGGVVVGGSLPMMDQTSATWVRRFTGDGDEVWTFSEPGEVPGYASASGVEVLGDAVFVTSAEPMDGMTSKLGVRRLDLASGAEVWQQEYDNDGLGVAYSNSAPDGDHLVVFGDLAADMNAVFVQRWDASGALLSTWTWSSPEWAYNGGHGAAVLPDGTTVVAAPGGVQAPEFDGSHLVGFAEDGTIAWAPKIAESWDTAVLGGVAVDGTRALVVGRANLPSSQVVGLLAVYSADGVEQSVRSVAGSSFNCGFEDIATHPDGVIVIGYCQKDQTGVDWWVSMLESP